MVKRIVQCVGVIIVELVLYGVQLYCICGQCLVEDGIDIGYVDQQVYVCVVQGLGIEEIEFWMFVGQYYVGIVDLDFGMLDFVVWIVELYDFGCVECVLVEGDGFGGGFDDQVGGDVVVVGW